MAGYSAVPTRAAPSSGESGESATDTFRRLYAEPNLLMVNNGQGWFDDQCEKTPGFCAATDVSRGLLTADVDADGDLDILVTNANGPVRLYRNDIPDKGNWAQTAPRRSGRESGRHRRHGERSG